MNNSSLEEFIPFVHLLADESEKVIMNYFRQSFKIERKDDNSPVTIADKNTEKTIRDFINQKYPNHGIIGEEFDEIKLDSEFTWVIDPIDGTHSFIAGHKDFGTLIALLRNKKPILGIINCPAHQERWVGIQGQPTTLNGNIIKTSKIQRLKDSYVFTSGLYFEDKIFRTGFDKIIKKTKYHRFGGDCYMYGMLASGLIDIVFEDTLKIYDYMALVPVIEGAGGVVTDKYNQEISLNSGGSIIASANSELHNDIFETLQNG
jgi:inositol-phosphate phosphatase/L-galactose 1-phosphate phosphatase/histidinol-phosphatase